MSIYIYMDFLKIVCVAQVPVARKSQTCRFVAEQKISSKKKSPEMILLMAEILHHLGCMKPYR